MFVAQPEIAAREMGLGLVKWVPDGTVTGIFQTMRPYMPPPQQTHHRLRSSGVALSEFGNYSMVSLNCASNLGRRRCGCQMVGQSGIFP
jgi:hypothetical protein